MRQIMYRYKYPGLYLDHSTYIEPAPDLLYRHTHSQYELLYILSGDLTHVVEDRKYKLHQHDLVIVRPNQYHFIQIDSAANYERYNLLFDPELLGLDNVSRLPADLEVVSCQNRSVITELFRKLDYYQSVLSMDDLQDMTALLLKELLYNLSLFHGEKGRSPTENLHPVAGKALAFINDRLFTIKNLGEVARELFVTESYLHRVFRRELKTTPLKYITDKRLTAAQNLLRQGIPATKVYEMCGFEDYSAFYRSYRTRFGHAPSQEGK